MNASHPGTGMNTLLPGRRRNGDILGLSLEESDALLEELRAHASRDEFTFRQQGKAGDVILWDKRATLHRRDRSLPPACAGCTAPDSRVAC